MFIANPIYDVVFKYMMEDNKVAKKFISAIIGETVLELEFSPQEHVNQVTVAGAITSTTVCRLDFLAKIVTPAGRRTVMVEVQKAKLPTDIMRFRQYLGGQYQNEENSYLTPDGQRKAMQIYCIFFLGTGLGIKDVPVLEVNHLVRDNATQQELANLNNEFIESLHHRSWIVQVSNVPKHRRNDLEVLLSIFDQNNRTSNHHILNVKEEDFPEEYRTIIRRLRQAAEMPEVQKTMKDEDYIIDVFRDQERKMAAQAIAFEALEDQKKALEEKTKALGDQKQALEEKTKALEENNKALEEKNEEKDKALYEEKVRAEERAKALEEKDKALEEMRKEIERLKSKK